MQTIVKATDPADLLALVPVLAGYRPVDSIVLVLFEGNRSSRVLRCDLPSPDNDVDSAASTLIGLACKVHSVDGIAIVVYSNEPYLDGEDLRHRPLVDALRLRADACGVSVKAALCSAVDAWGSYLDDSRAHPHDDIEQRSADSALPLPMVQHSQAAGTTLPSFDLVEKERVGRAILALSEARAILHNDPDMRPTSDVDSRALAAVCALDDPPEHFEDALGWDAATLEPYAAATLIWALDRPLLRDVAIAQWCHGQETGDEALAAQLDWLEGAEIPHRLAQHFWGDGPAPGLERLKSALALTRSLASLAPRDLKPGALATAAWFSWALGQSTHACVYAERAIAIDARHTLAAIVMSLASSGRVPEWVFERSVDEC